MTVELEVRSFIDTKGVLREYQTARGIELRAMLTNPPLPETSDSDELSPIEIREWKRFGEAVADRLESCDEVSEVRAWQQMGERVADRAARLEHR